MERVDAAPLPVRAGSYAGSLALGLAFAALLARPVLPWAKSLPGDWGYALFSTAVVSVLLFLCLVAGALVVRGVWEAVAVIRPRPSLPGED
jgi:hypothetical protein